MFNMNVIACNIRKTDKEIMFVNWHASLSYMIEISPRAAVSKKKTKKSSFILRQQGTKHTRDMFES